MGCDRFSVKTFLIAMLIAGVGFCFAWLLFIRAHWLFVTDAALILVLITYWLFRHINKTSRQLNDFLAALENQDTVSLDTRKTSSWQQQMLERINNLSKKLSLQNLEREKQTQFFKTLAINAGVGIIACQTDGKVLFSNNYVSKILGIKLSGHLDQLNSLHPNLSHVLLNQPGGSHLLLKLQISGNTVPVSFYLTTCRFPDQAVKIISFQNIGDDLSKQETESWQKLIRVLTHEIMNSTGPITSSIDTIRDFLVDEAGEPVSPVNINAETINDVLTGIAIVKERSIGLSRFVEDFRSLTFQPQLKIEAVRVLKIFENVRFLLEEKFVSCNIETEVTVLPGTLQIEADPHLIEQVILNLTLNAIQALGTYKNKKIQFRAFLGANNAVVIQVADNGEGIPDAIRDRIFVPFFTTRTHGSGIGLSISQRILQLHNAAISFQSRPGDGTCFEIVFTGSDWYR